MFFRQKPGCANILNRHCKFQRTDRTTSWRMTITSSALKVSPVKRGGGASSRAFSYTVVVDHNGVNVPLWSDTSHRNVWSKPSRRVTVRYIGILSKSHRRDGITAGIINAPKTARGGRFYLIETAAAASRRSKISLYPFNHLLSSARNSQQY